MADGEKSGGWMERDQAVDLCPTVKDEGHDENSFGFDTSE